MGADAKGHPTLSCTTCSFNIGNLDVHFSGGAAWLYNLFSSDIADSLKDALQGQVGTLYSPSVDCFSMNHNGGSKGLRIVFHKRKAVLGGN